jgi:hypothetical protein
MMATLGLASTGLAETNEVENGFDKIVATFTQTNNAPIPMLNVRARYEFGDQQGLEDSNAATIRARVGLKSQNYNGFSGLVEFEATRAAEATSYRPGLYAAPGKVVIADPESTELNRIQVEYNKDDNQAVIGRQRIIINNARFVGNVGWRQNEQTFDAFYYKNTMIEDLAIEYAYLDRVHRIFGSQAPYNARTWDSQSNIVNAKYSGLKGHTFAAYAYLLDFENAAAASSDSVGANYDFKGTVADDYTVTGYAEFAYQQDADNNPIDYDAIYLHFIASIARDGWSGNVGYELLGAGDGLGAFQTPLATAHKFEGWNDQFLATPANGVQDFYIGIGIPVPKVPMKLIFHHFTADSGSATYGNEIDYLAVHKFNPKTTALAKASYYASANETPGVGTTNVDRFRFSMEVNYIY